MAMHGPKSALQRYTLALISVCVAMVATRVLRGIGDAGITPLFFAAVLLSAWYGGLGPGLFATFISSLAAAYIILKARGATWNNIPEHILRLIVFSVVSILTSSLHGALRRAAEASTRAKEAAEAASDAKSRFIAMVSHELRTPLNPVLLLTAMMEKDQSLTPGVRNDIRTIRRNVDLELRLIDDLVDLTRISAGKLNLQPRPMDAFDAIKGAIEVCKDDVRENQLDLITHFDAVHSMVNGDGVRLQQVFWNLIRNAVKFTPEGGIIRIDVDNSVAGKLVVRICDSGIGIDPEKLSSIFKAFEQGGPDIQTRFGGLGLGLAICQAMVAAHHGTISAASEGKGKGASFSVILPLVGTSPDAAATAASSQMKAECV
ncbi:MAG TPA: HAMP domain-containing sensor histidine kinase [Tepidisphaeraceae bacterium]|jgi:signal transduction histidine kinase|nr:HAMP domain-containing sensor histidine kinase [Tepidisphaeraceae bacterium]